MAILGITHHGAILHTIIHLIVDGIITIHTTTIRHIIGIGDIMAIRLMAVEPALPVTITVWHHLVVGLKQPHLQDVQAVQMA